MKPEECKIGAKVWFYPQYETCQRPIACKIVYGPELMSYGEYACLLDVNSCTDSFINISLLAIRE